MDPITQAADAALEQFRASRSVEGRFLSYCRGRSRHFWTRQALVAVLFPIFLTIADWKTTVVAAIIVFLGEALDCAVLHRIGKRTSLGPGLPLALGITTLTAGVQALTISVFVALVIGLGGADARSLAGAVCLAALLDAGLLYGVHRGAALVRIVVYALALSLMVVQGLVSDPTGDARLFFDMIAAGLLAYVGWAIVRHVHKNRKRKSANQMAMLESARELAHANDALRDSRQMARRLAMVAERANDSVIIADDDGRITWVNRAFSQTTGYGFDEAVGRDVNFLNDPNADANAVAHLNRSRKNRRPARAELTNRHKNGRSIWVEVSMAPVFDDNGDFLNMISVERDIGEAKRRELALAEARQAAEAAVRARHNFLATMSHEIRTPMNGVIGTADLLLESELDDAQRALVTTITSSGEALLSIVNDILDFSKLEAGRFSVAHAPFSPVECIRGAADLVQPLAESKGLSLRVVLPSSVPGRVLGDEGRLRQVLLNLLGNAIKFTETGGVRIETAVRLVSDTCHFEISVRDTGIGIAPDRLEGVFDSFSQIDTAAAGRLGGTGLGLAISRLLLRAMGGDVTVRSQPGEGSDFTVRLALAVASEVTPETEQDGPADAASELPVFSGYRILIAEDNRTNTLLLDRMLSPLGPDLVFAVNGREAIEFYQAQTPDLVLMDMHMPILDGPAATRAIREWELAESRPETPILALTANAFPEDREICLGAGMDAVVTKPYRKQDLLRIMTDHLSLSDRVGSRATGETDDEYRSQGSSLPDKRSLA